ncbi:MAG: hypothetical protein ACOC1P_03995 [Minisyncoccales bacterium]
MKDNLEERTKNEKNSSHWYFLGGLGGLVFPEASAFDYVLIPFITTYALNSISDIEDNPKKSSEEKIMYSLKSGGKALIGATTIAGIRYLLS